MSDPTPATIAANLVAFLNGLGFDTNAEFVRVATHHIEAAIRQAEERGAGRASTEWLDKASSAQAAKVADVLKEFPRPEGVVISDPWPEAADNSKRSYDVAVDAMRGKLVEEVKALRAEAVERLRAVFVDVEDRTGSSYQGRIILAQRELAGAALDEALAWLSEANLSEIFPSAMTQATIKMLRREFKAIADAS